MIEEQLFTLIFAFYQNKVHENAKIHNFWDTLPKEDEDEIRRWFCSLTGILMREAAEVFESIRKREDAHVGEELADVVIMAMDIASGLNIDLGNEIILKMGINTTRQSKHGKAF